MDPVIFPNSKSVQTKIGMTGREVQKITLKGEAKQGCLLLLPTSVVSIVIYVGFCCLKPL